MDVVKNTMTDAEPAYLQDAHYGGAAKLGHGIGYKYPHDFPGHYVKQQYLPDSVEGTVFYEPSDQGKEVEIKKRLDSLKSK